MEADNYLALILWHKGPRFVIARRPQADVAISGRQLRFRRKCPIIRPSTARFPRRFAPRNDTSGERAVHQCTCAVELPSARCSGNAATDAIGSYRFIARLFVSPVRRRERHAAPLQFSIEIRKKLPEAQASGSFSNTINHNQFFTSRRPSSGGRSGAGRPHSPEPSGPRAAACSNR